MDEMKRVYHLLHNELDRFEGKNFDVNTVFALDPTTGEYVPIAEGLPVEAESLVKTIKKKNSKTISFVMMWQEAQLNMTRELSGNSLRVLTMLVGKMKYDNCVYGITQRKISNYLSMSTRTVIRAIDELKNVGLIIVTGKKGNKVYHINPAYAWKGSFHRMKYKLEMFDEQMKESDIWNKII